VVNAGPPDVVGAVKCGRVRYARSVAMVGETRNACRILIEKHFRRQ
jgi:hypothetical protein